MSSKQAEGDEATSSYNYKFRHWPPLHGFPKGTFEFGIGIGTGSLLTTELGVEYAFTAMIILTTAVWVLE